MVVGERASTPSWTVGKTPGEKGLLWSTIMAPDGAEVCTHAGPEVVEETELDVDELVVIEELDELVILVDEDEEMVEDKLEVELELVADAVLIQEQADEILDGKLEQAVAQVGRVVEVVIVAVV